MLRTLLRVGSGAAAASATVTQSYCHSVRQPSHLNQNIKNGSGDASHAEETQDPLYKGWVVMDGLEDGTLQISAEEIQESIGNILNFPTQKGEPSKSIHIRETDSESDVDDVESVDCIRANQLIEEADKRDEVSLFHNVVTHLLQNDTIQREIVKDLRKSPEFQQLLMLQSKQANPSLTAPADSLPAVEASCTRQKEAGQNPFNAVLDGIAAAFEAVGTGFRTLGTAIGNFFNNLGQKLRKSVENIAEQDRRMMEAVAIVAFGVIAMIVLGKVARFPAGAGRASAAAARAV